MSTSEIIQQIEQLPAEEQRHLFVLLIKKVIGAEGAKPKPWLEKRLSFEEACDIVFRENRELLSALAK